MPLAHAIYDIIAGVSDNDKRQAGHVPIGKEKNNTTEHT